jgi:hypothetical protein
LINQQINSFMKKSNLILFTTLLLLFAAGCRKKDTPAPPPAPTGLTVVSLNPTHGPHATVVTITGTNFSTVLSENTVRFNGVNAEVLSCSPTTLTVKVPKRAGTGKVTVTKGTNTAQGPVFEYEYPVDISYVAADSQPGLADGQGNAAGFFGLTDICYDRFADALYVTEFSGSYTGSNGVRKIIANGAVGEVTLVAGNRQPGAGRPNSLWGYEDNVNISAAKFKGPVACAVDPNGTCM